MLNLEFSLNSNQLLTIQSLNFLGDFFMPEKTFQLISLKLNTEKNKLIILTKSK